MEKEPWQEDIYENQEEETRTERRHRNQYDSGILANHILTVLAIIFFVIVVGMIVVLVYLSSGGSDRTSTLKDFYDSSAPKVEEVTTVATTAQSTEAETTQQEHTETHTDPEGTITVLAGEGEAAIAARAGISIAQLEALNPSHMSTGSWFANPGDVLKIR
ncbi:SAG1386/EF1546 family surface-associated protein [Streptococcus mitis]|mgnify:CR=1 FL=1|uniref:SAG1386/EF1546 family surface-associated protein n=1 Tax=Streptococcus mitis TaxID=28037 RepID=UPI0026EC13B8|nr:SAG1386/EF1546 family surface-associated protein [Streptococcus infantis]